MPKFSAHLTQLFTELPFEKRFEAAASNGFDACEFRSPYEFRAAEVRAWVRACGLPNILFNAPAGNWAAGDRGIAALPGREEEFGKSIDTAMRYADVLDTSMVHVMAGIVPPSAGQEDCHRTFVDNLRHAARELARSGRLLMIEAINRIDIPGYFLHSEKQSHGIREEVGAPNLLVQMDCYHASMSGADVRHTLEEYLPFIGHVQIAGAPGRHEPDTGTLDYRPILKLLDRLKYHGYVGCEYVPAADTVAGLGWMRAFR